MQSERAGKNELCDGRTDETRNADGLTEAFQVGFHISHTDASETIQRGGIEERPREKIINGTVMIH